MARSKNIENMSYAELTAMQARIERAKAERQSADRAELKQKMADMAKKHGFDMRELFDGRMGKGKRGKVATMNAASWGVSWSRLRIRSAAGMTCSAFGKCPSA